MPSDFTVIQAVRQRFGEMHNDPAISEEEIKLEPEVLFVGASKDYHFLCENVDSKELGVLQFETLGARAGSLEDSATTDPTARNIVRINGTDIPGGITPGYAPVFHNRRLPYWKAHTLLVPSNVLREQNVLHVESALQLFGHDNELDNFIIDNVVVFFKTRKGRSDHPSIG